MSIKNTPTFNLKAVIRETGIAADTLRAWERRYGLPMPERTPGGHRVYSQRDIEIIKWLMAKQGEGLSISHAVDLWNELTASGQDPLPATGTQVGTLSGANLDAVRQSWLEACSNFDENAAEQILNQAFAIYPLETVCIEVLQRGLVKVGEKWYHNEASVQQEHFTSALARRRLDALIAATPPPTRSQTILIGCTPKEQHSFIPLLLTLLLRRRGLKVVYLGANVPIQRFNETLRSVKPHLVVLSAQQLQTADGLLETVEVLNASGGRVAYGGRIFNQTPELRNHIPAHFLGESLQDAIQAVETLLTSDVALKGIEPIDEKDKNLSVAFTHNQPMIEVHVLTETNKLSIPIEFVSIAIHHLGQNLASALNFGNIEALKPEMEWIQSVLQERHQNHNSLKNFLTAYAKSIDMVMGKEGQPISNWLLNWGS